MRELDQGMVQIYTGDGKGKTTAALGLAFRAKGYGLNVLMLQFAKKLRCAEHDAAERVRRAARTVLADGSRVTGDVRRAQTGSTAGAVGTQAYADAVIASLRSEV